MNLKLKIGKRVIGATVSVSLVCALAACGSTSGTSNSTSAAAKSHTATGGSSQVTAAVNKVLVRPTSIGITTPIKGGVPKGKSVVFLQCEFPDCVQIGNAMTTAAAKVGWSVDRIGIGTTPESIVAAWQEALHRSPNAIINSGGYPRAYYQAELNQALARKIPLISFAEGNQGSPWNLVVGAGDGEGTITANIAAQFVASKISGGPVLAVTIPGVGVVAGEIAAFQKQLPSYCPKCSVNLLQIPPASVGTDAGSRIASYLQSHPDTKFVFLSTIDLALGLNAALASDGIQPVPTIAQTTSSVGLAAIKAHQAGLVATTEYPSVEGAYRAIDALARYFRGQPLTVDADATLPQWLITSANDVTGEFPLPAVENYASRFYALWGVK